MLEFAAALAAVLVILGVILLVQGLRGTPEQPARYTSNDGLRERLDAIPKRTKQLALIGVAVGLIAALFTGWVIAIVAVPAAVIGLPLLLSSGDAEARIVRLEAMEEWARSLAGVLTVGVGLEQAIIATLRSTPKAIETEVNLLAARLRARWPTQDAIRAFADDLDDATGDLLAANLLLGAQRRGAGLAAVLDSVATTVAEDVRNRRAVEADRAKPRATARWVTIITVVVLVGLFLSGSYVEPYKTPLGQLILAVLLAAYVGALIWMRFMSRGSSPTRFIGAEVAAKARQ